MMPYLHSGAEPLDTRPDLEVCHRRASEHATRTDTASTAMECRFPPGLGPVGPNF